MVKQLLAPFAAGIQLPMVYAMLHGPDLQMCAVQLLILDFDFILVYCWDIWLRSFKREITMQWSKTVSISDNAAGCEYHA